MALNILLVEPDYRSKFPPLGLMRISTFHKKRGDNVNFIRGYKVEVKNQTWDRIYISSLFTYDLPKTVKTINYYSSSVQNPNNEIIVGGIGSTLIPEYIEKNSKCKVITGPLDIPNKLGFGEKPIADLIPDYDIIQTIDYNYQPESAYFTRVSMGCIRKCKFCAVPILEPNFYFLRNITGQVKEVIQLFGEKKDLIVLDNNILALKNIIEVLREIQKLGFERGARFGRKLRFVDFNQGIDARLITPEIAKELGKINIRPIRLAFDYMAVKNPYIKAVKLLAEEGFRYFTTYVMFNFDDKPEQFYKRLRINIDLSNELDIKLTGFPMRFVPIDTINRHYISKNWNWKFLRGIQCILNATHGMVSPNNDFFDIAFGRSYQEFIEILSMPDNYIIYRNKYKEYARQWKETYNELDDSELQELYNLFNKYHHNVYRITHDNPKINRLLKFYEDKGTTKIPKT